MKYKENTNNPIACQAPSLLARSPTKQRGITAIGFIFLAVFIGLFVFAGLRLTPVYLNYMKVAGVLDGVLTEFDGQNPSRAAIRSSISRRFDVESVSEITARDVKVTSEAGGFTVEAVYAHSAPFIANVSFTVDFDKKVTIRR
jgi:hypothetical protein